MLLSYTLRTSFKKYVILTTAVTAGVIGFIALLAALVKDGADDKTKVSYIPTVVLTVIGFIWTINLVNQSHTLSLCFNRSRKTALKSIFAVTFLNVLFSSVLVIASELAVTGIAEHFGFGYEFKPLMQVLGLMKYNGAVDIIPALAFQLLFSCFVFAVAMFVMGMILRIGKWAWIGFWVFYMLLFFAGSEIVDVLKKASDSLGHDFLGGSGVAVLLAVLSAVFIFLFIRLFRKSEMNNSFMGIAKNA